MNAVRDLACPYCGVPFARAPQRKTKCKACGEFVYVRSMPDDPQRRLVTAERLAAIEAAWASRYNRNAENGVAIVVSWGVDESQARNLVGDGANLAEVLERLARILVTDGVTERQRRSAAEYLNRLSGAPANQVSQSAPPAVEHVAHGLAEAEPASLWRRLFKRLF